MLPSLHMPPADYPGFGHCIYCLEPFGPADLTDEHIVPLYLNGTHIIRKAACEPCRKRTNEAYEQTASNADFLVPRLLLELRRRKKSKPKTLPLVAMGDCIDGGGTFDVELTAAQYPPIIRMMILQPPGILCGIERDGSLTTVRPQFYHFGGRPEGAFFSNITTRELVDHTSVALTLAKIAYCHAVAQRGLGSFDGTGILDLLQGRREDTYNFVGSADGSEHLAARHLHGLYLRQRGRHLTALVHLFASCKMRPYEIVVGSI
jgi:hypothetical protein